MQSLNLRNVTLLGVDCVTPIKTLRSFNRTLRHCSFADVVLATDTDINDVNELKRETPQVRIVHRKQSNLVIEYPCFADGNNIITGKVVKDYEIDVHVAPSECTDTDYVLFQEWDACVINPSAWTGEFFEFDYIGAPWKHNKYAGISSSNSVGNGGFSLKSRKWCSIVAEYARNYDWSNKPMVSDAWACREMRKTFEELGLVYATEGVARKFSCENLPYVGQFGFHGKFTIEMQIKFWSSIHTTMP